MKVVCSAAEYFMYRALNQCDTSYTPAFAVADLAADARAILATTLWTTQHTAYEYNSQVVVVVVVVVV